MQELISFSDLMKQAEAVSGKINKHVSISVTFDVFERGDTELQYGMYTNKPPKHRYFNTVQELQETMDTIINPETDVGVSLGSEGE